MGNTELSEQNVGIVVIGRNEGVRLRSALESVHRCARHVVYVDSGSEDESVAIARSIGIHVIKLDPGEPFTAARARNVGYAHLFEMHPNLRFVQFLDGDCTLTEDWIPAALAFIEERPEVGVVCGHLGEKGGGTGLYNRLCAMEWDRPSGQDTACGGIALFRREAITAVGGFDPKVIAAEDDEVCARLRVAGWQVWRIEDEMAIHDADIVSFRQWWKRSTRTGHAFAELVDMHGAGPMAHWRKPLASMIGWGLLPVPILLLAFAYSPWFGCALLAYPLHAVLIGRRRVMRGAPVLDGMAFGFFCVLGRFPGLIGVTRYHTVTKRRRRVSIIEYK